MSTLTIADKRLGAALIEGGVVSDEDLQRALERQAAVGGRLADTLIEMGLLSERRIAQAIEEKFGIPLVDLHELEIPPEVRALLPAERAKELEAIPFAREGDKLRVAFTDPLDNLKVEEVEDLTGLEVEPYQTLRSSFEYALAKNYPELGLPLPEKPRPVSEAQVEMGEYLLEKGLLTPKQLEQALAEQEKTGELLGRILTKRGWLTEEALYRAVAEREGLDFLPDTEDLDPDPAVASYLLRSDALRYQAIPVEERKGRVTVVLGDPRHRNEVKDLLKRKVRFLLTPPSAWDALFKRVYPEHPRLGEALVESGKLDREELAEALMVQSKLGKTRPLGEILVELGFVRPEDVEEALRRQRAGGGKLEDTLIQTGKISPEMLAQSLAVQLGYPYIDPDESPPDPLAAEMIPEAAARRYTVFPHHLDEEGQLVVLMKDPRNIFAIDDLQILTGKEIQPAVSTEEKIVKLIERYYGTAGDLTELARELAQGSEEEVAEDESALDDNAVVRLVNQIIREAYLQEASDIHIEPREEHVLVRIRVDGALREYTKLPKSSANAIIARIKIMGRLNIAEKRVPQDGRVRFKDRSIDVDLRLSTIPTVYGEKAVMRLLRKASEIPEIEQLGFAPDVLQRFKDVISKPYGIFLITGPTGSGKSFTTFSILKRISTPDKNTMTVEDPVEYEIPGINQVQVNPQAGLDFARALRAFLRQDPDIIMVGEIRDTETAKIAVEAALTGHLVIATLHTNDASGAITRLDEMGVELFNISASLIGVLAQRLVRRVCEHCKVEVEPDPDVLRRLELKLEDLEGATLYKGAGCERCNGTGYKGRYAIHELLVIDDEIRHAIIEGKTATEIKELARKKGMKTLREDGIQKALQGITTLEEVMARTIE